MLVTAPPASAAPTHVGLVVRYPNGTVAVGCAAAGGSGLAVLSRKFTVLIGQQPPYAGFVFKINNQGSTRPDNTHYWSYWHSPGNGTWTYSAAGAGSHTPEAGTVEGWSYVNGQASAPKPPARKYAGVCAGADAAPKPTPKPAPKPTPKPAPKPAPTRNPPAGPTPAPARHSAPTPPPAASAPTPGSVPQRRAAAAPARSSLRARPARQARQDAPATRVGTAGTPTASVTSAAAAATRAPHRAAPPSPARSPLAASAASPLAGSAASPVAGPGGSGGGVPAWGTVAALAVVAGLGGFAWLRLRRGAG